MRLILPIIGYVCLLLSYIECDGQTLSYVDNEVILRKTWITIGYDTMGMIPNYVVEKLTPDMIVGDAKRSKFYADSTIRNGVTPSDYTGSGYDRGHLAPAANYKFSQKATDETFVMTNMCPQTPELNRRSWLALEDYIRDLVGFHDTLVVLTGTYGDAGKIKNKVTIPEKVWKIAVGKRDNEVLTIIGWIYLNGKSRQSVENTAVSIDDIEQLINRDIQVGLSESEENTIKIKRR